jgi:hypothetical protein
MRSTKKHPSYFFRILLILGVSGFFFGQSLLAEYRVWNSKVGTEVEAQFLSQTATHVVLKTKDGKQLTVEKVKLSENDQEFLKWLAEDAKKPADNADPAAKLEVTNKPSDTAKPAETVKSTEKVKSTETAKPPATAKPDPAAKPAPSVELPPTKKTASNPPGKPPLPGQPAGTKPLEKTDPLKLEQPYNTFPLSIRNVAAQKILADPPNTDYTKLARELCAPVPRPKFAALNKFKIPLVNPTTAMIAQAGNFLIDHNDKLEQLDVWNLDTGKLVNSIKVGPLANSRSFAISPLGNLVASGRSDNVAIAYHAATGKEACIVPRQWEEKKKLVRVAFSWEEDELFSLNDKAEVDRQLLFAPPARRQQYLGAAADIADWTANNDEIWLTVTGQGRVGTRLTDRYTTTCYMQKQDSWFKAKARRHYLAIPVRNGLVYWSKNELTRYSVSYTTRLDAEKQRSETVKHRAIDCIDFDKYSLDRADRYLWVSNATATGTLDIYDLDCFDVPVRVPTPVQKQGQQLHWHSCATRRLYYYDPATTEITVHELRQFEPPPQWKVQEVFQRGLIEKRYDRLDGLAAVMDKDMRHLVGGRQLPVLTEVLDSFIRQQFLVPPEEWLHRKARWFSDRPDSTLARLVQTQVMINYATSADDPGQKEKRLIAAAELLKGPLAAKKPYGEALYMQLGLGTQLGWEKDKFLELAAQLAQAAPEHTEFHHQMCKLLLPDKRGEAGDTELYAKTIANHFPQEKGDMLYGQMVYRCLLDMDDNDFFDTLDFDLTRATRGLVADAKKNPTDPVAITRAQDWHTALHRARHQDILEPFKADYRPISTAYVDLLKTGGWNAYLKPRD